MNAVTDKFRGHHELIAGLDEAVAKPSTEEVVAAVRAVLCGCMRDDSVRLPDACHQALAGRYARRLIHHSLDYGYSVVAMTWGPGQRTPIHDHCGMWCVEGIWAGEIEVVQYELLERAGDRFRFERRGCMQACVGSAGSLIPPHEYHTIANPSDQALAISVHVYSGAMTRCNAFVADGGDGWHRRESRALGFD